MTNLPATEEAYNKSIPQETPSLETVLNSQGAAALSSFGGVVLMAHFFGCNLLHLQRPEPDDREHDIQGVFWKRHRSMDNTLLNTSLNLPLHLRLPAGVRDPNTVFLNLNIHTSTICLHQAAIFKAEQNNMPNSLIEQSNTRCLLAASEITSIMRLINHLDASGMNPFMAFCVYIAARVFVHFLKRSPHEEEVLVSLRFLLNAMNALKRTQPITGSFLIQLNLDIQASGLGALLKNPEISSSRWDGMVSILSYLQLLQFVLGQTNTDPQQTKAPTNDTFEGFKCSPLFEIREAQKRPVPGQVLFEARRDNAMYELFQSLDQDSKRPPQPSLRDFSIPSREQRQLRTYDYQTAAFPSQQNSPLNQDWASGPGAVNAFDAEMSDLASAEYTSTGLTPSNSHHTSSSISQHSPASDTDQTSAHETSPSKPAGSPYSFFVANGTQIDQPSEPQPTSLPTEPPRGQQQQDSGGFTLPAEWRLESTGETRNLAAGMTPLGEGEWTQMLEGMGWEGMALGAEAMPWTTSTESIT